MKGDALYRFLARFAHPEWEPGRAIPPLPGDLLPSGREWEGVAALAEEQGIAPLLYRNLKVAGVEAPVAVRRELQGCTVRHRYEARVRTAVMEDVLRRLESEEIRPLVLKGGALGHLLYKDPGLRPASDLDLLVTGGAAGRAFGLLADMGFQPTTPSPSPSPVYLRKHLPQVFLRVDRLDVKIDLHHELFRENRPHRMRAGDLLSPSLSFSTGEGGVTALTLGREDMLRHLILHLCDLYHEPTWSGMTRLIWIADVVGFAERFADGIDWEGIARRVPWVLSSLGLIHHVTPLSEGLREAAGLEIPPAPGGPGKTYGGWPASPWARQGAGDLPRWLRETLVPPEWWLRLYYGLGTGRSLVYHRWVRHPLHLAANLVNLVQRRLEGPQ